MPAARLEKLEAVLARAAPPDEDVAFLANLLSLPSSERHPLPNLSPQRKKERTRESFYPLARTRGSACRRGSGVLRTGKAAPHLRFVKKRSRRVVED